MKLIIQKNHETLSRWAAQFIVVSFEAILAAQSNLIWLPSAGKTPTRIYELLTTKYKQHVDWERVIILQMDEYLQMSATDSKSFAFYLQTCLIHKLPLKKHYLIDADAAFKKNDYLSDYEHRIQQLGGIDFALHGIGTNAHIGFNEPGTALHSPTRIVDLAQDTLVSNQTQFGNKNVPSQGVTLGLAILTQAKQNLVIASGESKAQAVSQILVSDANIDVPATCLKNKNMTFLVDEAAAKEILVTKTTQGV